MSSQLTKTSSVPAGPTTRARRARTFTLETQSAYKFGLAVVIGAATIFVANPIVVSAVLMALAVAIAGRALTVLAADPRSARALSVREFALWDGALAAVLAFVAVIAAAVNAENGAVIAGSGAIVLAGLRLRTRYAA